jgi:hypothetical protein
LQHASYRSLVHESFQQIISCAVRQAFLNERFIAWLRENYQWNLTIFQM